MKVIYMGTPDFAVPALEEIHRAGFDIPLVVTQEDRRRGRGKKFHPTEVKAKALELGLEVFQPKSINSPEAMEILRELEPDLIVVAAYGQILKKELLDLPKYGCVNIHASLLPKYRGAAPINRAIIEGEEETGISIMQMAEGLDTGDILKMDRIKIHEDDDSQIVHDRLADLGSKMIVGVLENIEELRENRLAQDDTRASYAEKIYRDTGLIDWKMKGQDLKNFIRGLKPWPGAYTFYEGRALKIDEIELLEKKSDDDLGKVLRVSEDGIEINGLDSTVLVKVFQFPGKKMMKVEDYLRGNDFEEGIILGK